MMIHAVNKAQKQIQIRSGRAEEKDAYVGSLWPGIAQCNPGYGKSRERVTYGRRHSAARPKGYNRRSKILKSLFSASTISSRSP